MEVKGTCAFQLEGKDARLMLYDVKEWEPLIQRAMMSTHPHLIKNPRIADMWGKPSYMHRQQCFYGDPEETYGYFFSGQLAKATPFTEPMRQLLDQVNAMFGTKYNGVLINVYDNPDDYISDHRDSEKGLDKTQGVLAISYGGERTFRLKHWNHTKNAPYPKKERPWFDIRTKSCQIIHMVGEDFQKELAHGIPPEPKSKARRYSATFRVHCKEDEEDMYRRWKRKREE